MMKRQYEWLIPGSPSSVRGVTVIGHRLSFPNNPMPLLFTIVSTALARTRHVRNALNTLQGPFSAGKFWITSGQVAATRDR